MSHPRNHKVSERCQPLWTPLPLPCRRIHNLMPNKPSPEMPRRRMASQYTAVRNLRDLTLSRQLACLIDLPPALRLNEP